jgi:hypothetical protein
VKGKNPLGIHGENFLSGPYLIRYDDHHTKELEALFILKLCCSAHQECILPLNISTRLAPAFGLPKPITILVAHLLLNIKKHHKSLKIFYAK